MKIRTKGFTLIELIVVMGIMTILSSILVINYLTYIKRANDAKSEQIARMIYTSAMRTYAEDENFKVESVFCAVKEDISMNQLNIRVNTPSNDESCISVNFSSNNTNYTVYIDGKNTDYTVAKSK